LILGSKLFIVDSFIQEPPLDYFYVTDLCLFYIFCFAELSYSIVGFLLDSDLDLYLFISINFNLFF